MENQEQEVLYSDISGDDYRKPQEIESMCMNCQANGITKLLLTRIPHYKEVILMSFHCTECGFSNNEIQSGGKIQEQGVRLEVVVKNNRDLSRQVVKSDYAHISIPELDLEIPQFSQKGEITTVEGILTRTITALGQDQPVRLHMEPEAYKTIKGYIEKIEEVLEMKKEFRLILEDPSGNSFIENPLAPATDPALKSKNFIRSKAQDHALGLYTAEEVETQEEHDARVQKEGEPVALTEEQLKEEVLHFDTNCPECNAPATTNMKMTNIPFFKEVVIMATVCDACGNKTNEVKSGAGIEKMGKKITLKVEDPSDLNRDILKSETCSIAISELEFEMGGMALGGRFTTVEGLLENMQEQIEKNSIWGAGDATAPDVQDRMAQFKEKFNLIKSGEEPFTLILDDPAGNSYLQNLYAPDPDPNMLIEEYERTFDQNEDLGLNDMKTENYQES